jgi:tetratricopeptide (TPR) repeat protein
VFKPLNHPRRDYEKLLGADEVNKLKIMLAISIGAIAIAAAAYWVLVQQPAQRAEAARAERTLLESGILLFSENKLQEALNTLERIPSSSEHGAKARYYQGNTQIMLKDYESAAQQLEQSLALDNDNTDTLFALGVTYFKLGNLKLSRSYFALMLEVYPETGDPERMQEAKGLMDIVARLERLQPQPATDAGTSADPAPDEPADGGT